MNSKDSQKVKKILDSRISRLEKTLVSKISRLDRITELLVSKIDLNKKLAKKEFDKKIEIASLEFNKQVSECISTVNANADIFTDAIEKNQKESSAMIERNIKRLDTVIRKDSAKNKAATQNISKKVEQWLKSHEKDNDSAISNVVRQFEDKLDMIGKVANSNQIAGRLKEKQFERYITELRASLNTLDTNEKEERTRLRELLNTFRIVNEKMHEEHRNKAKGVAGLLNKDMIKIQENTSNRLSAQRSAFVEQLEKTAKKLEDSFGLGLKNAKEATDKTITEMQNELTQLDGMLIESDAQAEENLLKNKEALKKDMKKLDNKLITELKKQNTVFKQAQNELRETFENKMTELGSKEKELAKSIDDNKTELAKNINDTANGTIEILETRLKELNEGFNTEIIRLSTQMDDISESYATKKLLYSTKVKIENQNRMREGRINEVLRELKKMGIGDKKDLNKVAERVEELDSSLREDALESKRMFEDATDALQKRCSELAATVDSIQQNVLLKISAKDFEKSLKAAKNSSFKKIIKSKSDIDAKLKSRDSEYKQMLAKIKDSLLTDISSVKKDYEINIKNTSSAFAEKITGLSERLDTAKKMLSSYIQKNESLQNELAKGLTQKMDDTLDSAVRQVAARNKEIKELVDGELIKFRDNASLRLQTATVRQDKRLTLIEKGFKQESLLLRQRIGRLDKASSEYRQANESDKKVFSQQTKIDIAQLKDKISQMLRFEESLTILNNERIQLMSTLEGFLELKKEINKDEEIKLSRFNELVKDKSKEFRDIITKTSNMPKPEKSLKRAQSKKEKPKKEDHRIVKKLAGFNNISDQIKYLKDEGMKEADIIRLFKTEYGEYKATRAQRSLRIMKK